MAGRMTPAGAHLERLTARLVRDLPALCHGRTSTPYRARGQMPGELRSRRVIARGTERREPRLFSLEDEPTVIDVARMPASAVGHLAEAAILGQLRAIQSMQVIESEFVAVVDLSRSMLSGFFAEHFTPPAAGDPEPKICPLFYTVASFLHLAGRLGFWLRAICAQGQRVHNERARTARDFMESTLGRMRAALLWGHDRAESDPEAFNLVHGLGTALSVRVRSVVLVVSDFLDPFDQYREGLAELMARHHVILVDVADAYDVDFPEPGLLDINAMRIPVREGARHLEEGVRPELISRGQVRKWNERLTQDRRRLEMTVRRGGAELFRLGSAKPRGLRGRTGFARCYATAMDCLGRIS